MKGKEILTARNIDSALSQVLREGLVQLFQPDEVRFAGVGGGNREKKTAALTWTSETDARLRGEEWEGVECLGGSPSGDLGGIAGGPPTELGVAGRSLDARLCWRSCVCDSGISCNVC